MTKNEWNQEMANRNEAYFGYLGEAYMKRSIYEWNIEFINKYNAMNEWTSNDYIVAEKTVERMIERLFC